MSERRHDLLERLGQADSFAHHPGNCADSPPDRMDALSQILSRGKLLGAVFFTAEFSAPWGFSTAAPIMMVARIAPGAAHLVLYQLCIKGGAVIALAA